MKWNVSVPSSLPPTHRTHGTQNEPQVALILLRKSCMLIISVTLKSGNSWNFAQRRPTGVSTTAIFSPDR